MLLPSDIPLGSIANSRFTHPANTVTRMKDALSMLISVAQTQPDIDLIPWVEKELCRLAYRHYEDDIGKTAKFLGTQPERFVFTTNVSASINLIAGGFTLDGPGEILGKLSVTREIADNLRQTSPAVARGFGLMEAGE